MCNVNEVNTEGKSPDFVLVISYHLGHEATISHKQNYVGERQEMVTQFWYGSSWRTEGMVNYYGTALREGYGKLLLTGTKHLRERKVDFSAFTSRTIFFFTVQHLQLP